MKTCVLVLALLLPSIHTECPDQEAGLQPWMPGHSEDHRVTIGYGRKVLLTASATVHSIEILNGGKLVVADSGRPILLRTKHLLIGNQGELHVGSPDCPYKGNLTISLYGRYEGVRHRAAVTSHFKHKTNLSPTAVLLMVALTFRASQWR